MNTKSNRELVPGGGRGPPFRVGDRIRLPNGEIQTIVEIDAEQLARRGRALAVRRPEAGDWAEGQTFWYAASEVDLIEPAADGSATNAEPRDPRGESPRVITGGEALAALAGWLHEIGVLAEGDRAMHTIIDMEVGHPVRVYVEKYGDERALAVRPPVVEIARAGSRGDRRTEDQG